MSFLFIVFPWFHTKVLLNALKVNDCDISHILISCLSKYYNGFKLKIANYLISRSVTSPYFKIFRPEISSKKNC